GRGLKRPGSCRRGLPGRVAPHAGAWIETLATEEQLQAVMSPPTRGRGLKPDRPSLSRIWPHVAPHAGAWIETKVMAYLAVGKMSSPTRGRGLEPLHVADAIARLQSPPTRGRGLKPSPNPLTRPRARVAPHAGAWIETAGAL